MAVEKLKKNERSKYKIDKTIYFNLKDTDNGHEEKLLDGVRKRNDSWNRLRGLIELCIKRLLFLYF